jgi:hypothetical protein
MSQQNLVQYKIFPVEYQTRLLGQTVASGAKFQNKRIFCPCCSDVLLRHVRRSGVYQLCRSCRQEMPDLQAIQIQHYDR